jgi:hypothetical protein
MKTREPESYASPMCFFARAHSAQRGVAMSEIAVVSSKRARLLERIEHEVGRQRRGDPPAHDAPREDIDHERHVNEGAPPGDVGEVRHPELIGPRRGELAINEIDSCRNRSRSCVGSISDSRPARIWSISASIRSRRRVSSASRSRGSVSLPSAIWRSRSNTSLRRDSAPTNERCSNVVSHWIACSAACVRSTCGSSEFGG